MQFDRFLDAVIFDNVFFLESSTDKDCIRSLTMLPRIRIG